MQAGDEACDIRGPLDPLSGRELAGHGHVSHVFLVLERSRVETRLEAHRQHDRPQALPGDLLPAGLDPADGGLLGARPKGKPRLRETAALALAADKIARGYDV